MSLGRTLESFEREALVELVERHSWNVLAAAREIGISRYTLAAKLQRHAILRPMVKRPFYRCGCGASVSGREITQCQSCAAKAAIPTRKARTGSAQKPSPRWPLMTPFALRMQAMYGTVRPEADQMPHLVGACHRLKQRVANAAVLAQRDGDTVALAWCSNAATTLETLIAAGQ